MTVSRNESAEMGQNLGKAKIRRYPLSINLSLASALIKIRLPRCNRLNLTKNLNKVGIFILLGVMPEMSV